MNFRPILEGKFQKGLGHQGKLPVARINQVPFSLKGKALHIQQRQLVATAFENQRM